MIKIDEFIEKVLGTDKPFNLYQGNVMYRFLQDKVGKARYIYCASGIDNFYVRTNNNYKVVAIVKDNVVYIIDRIICGLYDYDSIQFPGNIMLLSDYVKQFNQDFFNIDFPKWYDKLQPQKVNDLDEYIQDARLAILYNGGLKNPSVEDAFDIDNVASIIAEFTTILDVEQEYFVNNKQKYIYFKTKNNAMQELIDTYKAAKPWEIDMAEALRTIDIKLVKTVQVEFNYNGKINTIRIEPYDLLRMLVHKLSIKHSSCTCENITRIKYRRKVLYERN